MAHDPEVLDLVDDQGVVHDRIVQMKTNIVCQRQSKTAWRPPVGQFVFESPGSVEDFSEVETHSVAVGEGDPVARRAACNPEAPGRYVFLFRVGPGR